MRTLLEIYFGINLFLAGYCYCYRAHWSISRLQRIRAQIQAFLILFLGLIYVVLKGIKRVLNYIIFIRRIEFWWELNILKKYDNLESYTLTYFKNSRVETPTTKQEKNLNKEIDTILKRNEK